jgi:plastocyanin
MNGTFKVVTSGGGGGATTGGGGGGGTSGGGGFTTAVTASGIAFDVATITLKANTATTLTFDNKDAGIPHNIAIYPSASELTSPLFRGDIITGPATAEYRIPPLKPGTYYFQCDVHPTTMNGQVIVK